MRWIIGDIHGMLKPLARLVEQIPHLDSQPTYYFVGDYVNRGPESCGVIDLLLTLRNAKFIRGNHDDVLDQILHGAGYAPNDSHGDRFLAMQWFLEHGLYETLVSYGVTREQIARVIGRRPDALEAIVSLFPGAHRDFIHSLPVYIDDPDLFVVHGKWPINQRNIPAEVIGNGSAKPAQRWELLWGRFTEAELSKPQSWPKRGFFGHTPVPTYSGHEFDFSPIVFEKMVLLDTAAALSTSGRLSAMCAETSQLVQVDPTGRQVTIQ